MVKVSYPELLNLNASGPLFGQLMLRDLLLPDLLGEEGPTITYWAGRSLARRLPVAEAQLPVLFARIGFGELTATATKNHERTYTLAGSTVATRIVHFTEPDFRMEAGFLAQSLQQELGMVVEATATVERRKQQVIITVAMDPDTPQPVAEMRFTLSAN